MAWPITTAPAFTFDTGIQDVPALEAEITPDVKYLMGGSVRNTTAAQLTYTLKNSAGKVVSEVDVPQGATVDVPSVSNMRPSTGLKDGGPTMVGLQRQLWGW